MKTARLEKEAIIETAYRSSLRVLEHASLEFLTRDGGSHYAAFMKKAVAFDGMALRAAKRALPPKAEEEWFDVVKTAVASNGLALRYAPAGLKDDPVVLHNAFRSNGMALGMASPVKKDSGLIDVAVQQNGMALQFVVDLDPNSEHDGEIVRSAVESAGSALKFAKQYVEALTDHEKKRMIVLKAVSSDGLALEFAPEELRNEHLRNERDELLPDQEQIAKVAVENNPLAIEFV
eukprot:751720-Rhodomonas_salina.1